jgi:hypothetical protein
LELDLGCNFLALLQIVLFAIVGLT